MKYAIAPAALLLLASALSAAETLPKGAKVLSLSVQPATIELTSAGDYRQLLVTAKLESGDSVDVTRLVERGGVDCLNTESAAGVVRPKADGEGQLTLTLGDKSASVPVKVTGMNSPPPASFVKDVMPVISKLGCNAGTCHGAQDGKNGFKLSLRGYDPLYDHRALTDDHAGRRFNRAAPDQSLMLLKPAGVVPHVGGVLCKPGEPYYELIRSWIAAGVKLDLETPRVTSIEISPQKPVVPLPGMKQQIRVLANYGDGSQRDVTLEAFVDSSLAETVEVDKRGLATAVRRGEAALLARYEGSYAATTITVMGDRSGFVWQGAPENNFVDTLVYNKLKQVKILPSDLCTDAEFIRRVYLDLTGLPPSPEQVLAFMADKRETRLKRDEVIDRLIGSPEFIELWTNKWADLLQVNRKFLGDEGSWAFRNWIRQAISTNMPYDKFAQEVLTARGSTLENPPASYYKVLREPVDVMENTTQLFLAVRFNCNKCHDHPFERWTQDQYYQLSAYFAQVGRKDDPEFKDKKIGGTAVEGAKALVEVIYDQTSGDVTHARTNVVTAPKFPYSHGDLAPTDAPRREQLSRWLTSKENQYFAKSYVNRIWSYLLGLGIIDPIDDIRAGNPATNAELLDRLSQEFVAGGFNVQEVFRTICKSRTYQHSIVTNKWNEDDEINYSHAIARRLPAETLYDAVHRATGATEQLPGVPVGFRATEMPDSTDKLPDDFLGLFGKPPRESACECERSGGVILGQALNLVNGPTLANAIAAPNNRIAKLIANEKDDVKVVEGLFVAILCRLPTEKEVETGIRALHSFEAEQAELKAALVKFEQTELPKRTADWIKSTRGPANWTVLDPVTMISLGGATPSKQADGSILLSGANPDKETLTLVFPSDLANVTALRLELLPDDSLPAKGPGRAANGNLVLNELKLAVTPKGSNEAKPAELQNASADFQQEGYPASAAIDGNVGSGWALAPEFGKPHAAVFETKENLGGEGSTFTVVLDQQFGTMHTIGRLRLAVTNASRPVNLKEGQTLPKNVVDVLAVAPETRTAEQLAELAKYYRTIDPELIALTKAVGDQASQAGEARLKGAQDLAWVLLNTPAFLFNR